MQNTEIWQWRRRENRPQLIKVSERQAAIFLSKNHFSKGGIYFRKEEFSRYFNEVQKPNIEPIKPMPEPIKPMPEPIKEEPATIKEVVWENEVNDTAFDANLEPLFEEKPKRRRRKNNN